MQHIRNGGEAGADGSSEARFFVDSEGEATDTGDPREKKAENERLLDRDIQEMLLEPARRVGIELKPGRTRWPVPEQPTIYEGKNGRWLVSKYSDDLATLEAGGRVPAPEEAIERLRLLESAGLSCDVVVVAHQLPEDWKPGQRIVPSPPKTGQYRALKKFSDSIASASRVLAHPAARAGAGKSAPRKSAPKRERPTEANVVYGGVERGDTVKWVELARWDW